MKFKVGDIVELKPETRTYYPKVGSHSKIVAIYPEYKEVVVSPGLVYSIAVVRKQVFSEYSIRHVKKYNTKLGKILYK